MRYGMAWHNLDGTTNVVPAMITEGDQKPVVNCIYFDQDGRIAIRDVVVGAKYLIATLGKDYKKGLIKLDDAMKKAPKPKLCRYCNQPMKPKGVKKLPNEYDHAQGCRFARKKK